MYAAVKKAYHVNYVRSLVKAGYSKGQIRKYFVKPLIERDRQEKVAWLQEHEKIAEGVNKFNRGEELLEGIIANPQTGLTDWVENIMVIIIILGILLNKKLLNLLKML